MVGDSTPRPDRDGAGSPASLASLHRENTGIDALLAALSTREDAPPPAIAKDVLVST